MRIPEDPEVTKWRVAQLEKERNGTLLPKKPERKRAPKTAAPIGTKRARSRENSKRKNTREAT